MKLRVDKKMGHQDTRTGNRRLILQFLFRSDSSSRAELARLTGLTPATVSSLVAPLIDEGLVLESDSIPVGVGKPSRTLQLNARAFASICVDLSERSKLRVAALDLKGRDVYYRTSNLQDAMGEEAYEFITEKISDAIQNINQPLLGIGVGTPGIVTPTGEIVEASNFGWSNLHLSKQLQDRFKLPTVTFNDANAFGLAEYSVSDSGCQNLLAIKIGYGIGAGIIFNGNLHLGEIFAAGEIGHVVVEDAGPPCRCGNNGCLETFLSKPILSASDIDEAFIAATGERLGRALSSVVSMLDIHNIVIADTGLPFQIDLCEIALATLKKRTLKHFNDIDIRLSKLGSNGVLIGVNQALIYDRLGIA